jgi:hypothetical protein
VRRLARTFSTISAAGTICLLLPGCGSSRTYNADELKREFDAHGVELVTPADRWLQPRWVDLITNADQVLQPRSREDFLVLVLSEAHAKKAWSALVTLGPDSDSFDARRANVLVIADDGVSPDTRRRILSALGALPDHGDRVEIIKAVSQVAPPMGTWRALTWKCEDTDSRGRPVGPVIVSNSKEAQDLDRNWYTRTEARVVARRLGLRFTIDC